MSTFPLTITTSDGRKITLSVDDWHHIRFRHPEVGEDPNALARTVSHPDEIYIDERGGVHALRRIDEKHFLVVIFKLENEEGYIRTAYLTKDKRKKRRYRQLQSLKRF